MNTLVKEIGVIAAGIIGLAIVAVLVSNRAATANVFTSAGRAFSGAIGAAVSPVTGASMPGGFGGFSGQGSVF